MFSSIPDITNAILAVGAIFPIKGGTRALSSLLGRKDTQQPKVDDLSWIDGLPAGNSLVAMETILQKLGALAPALTQLEPSQLSCDTKTSTQCPRSSCNSCIRMLTCVYQISKQCNHHLITLEKQYASVQKLSPKIDDLIWDSVHGYYRFLIRAYQACIDDYQAKPETSQLQSQHLCIVIAHLMENLCSMTRWYHMRYQDPPNGHWLQIHKVYRLAEKRNCTGLSLKLHNGIECSIDARYARALMLDTINFSGMQKSDINRIDEWLNVWMKGIAITPKYHEENHLFYTNLDEDHGARRIRHFQPTDACRYWETDRITEGIPQFRKLLQKGEKHFAFEIVRTSEIDQCLVLLDNLYAEWSRSGYRRQRRREERQATMRQAYVAHGLQGCYQMVKDMENMWSSRKGYARRADESLDERLARHSVLQPATNIALPWLSGESWSIQNESPLGCGAIVPEEIANRLKVGRLVAMVMDDNREQISIGALRSIRSHSNNEWYLGVEVFSRTVSPVMLTNLGFRQGTSIPEPLLAGADPFSMLDETFVALILPENPASGIEKPSIILNIANYIENARLSVTSSDRGNLLIRLTDVVEQKDNWIRVGFEK